MMSKRIEMLNRHLTDGALLPASLIKGKAFLVGASMLCFSIAYFLGEISSTSSIQGSRESFDLVQMALPAAAASPANNANETDESSLLSVLHGGANTSVAITMQRQPSAIVIAETIHTTGDATDTAVGTPSSNLLAARASNNSSLNHDAQLPMPSDNVSVRDTNWIIPVNELKQNGYRRAQFQLGEVNHEFLEDIRKAQDQLTSNYYFRSSCQRVRTNKVIRECYGLGGTISTVTRYILRRMKMKQVLHRLDVFTCTWFKNDKTKQCDTMFGNCYFPAVEAYVKTSNDTQCHNFGWFYAKYGEYGLYAVIMSWMFGGITLSDNLPPTASDPAPLVEPPEPCIAIHIRRGDACITKTRKCLEYDAYLRVIQLFVDRYPHLNRLVVLTDAHDFPLEKFQVIIPNISYSTQYNRSRYNVEHLRNESYAVTAPEHRNMENATSELLSELAEGSQCTALIGTFSAAVSKILFNLMLMRQGRVPLHYSLDGCGKNIWYAGMDREEGCEKAIIQPSIIRR